MFLSVIIPLYNKEKGITKTIESILHQQFMDYEVIIIDDGSTDKSIEMASVFADKRIQIFSKNNAGPSAARNKGVKIAKGDWVVFIDADDEFTTGALEHYYSLSKKYININCFVCNHYLEFGGKQRIRSSYYPDRLLKNSFRSWFFNLLQPCQGAVMLKRSVALTHPYPEGIRRWEDAAMMFDVMRDEQIFRSHKPVFIYHREMSAGSKPLKDISLDFYGHLNPKGKSFWEKMCLYKMYRDAKRIYPGTMSLLYSRRFTSIDVRFAYQICSFCISLIVETKQRFFKLVK